MLLTSVAVGWTAELGPFTLRLNGAPLPLDGTVELILTPPGGPAADTSGDVRLAVDQGSHPGQVYYKPDDGDFGIVGTYDVHFKVTDAGGDVTFHPQGAPDQIEVYRP